MAKKQFHHFCTVKRRWLATTGTLSLSTGEMKTTSQEWKSGPCNVPLFSEQERETGVCRSCANGWTHEQNYRIDDNGNKI